MKKIPELRDAFVSVAKKVQADAAEGKRLEAGPINSALLIRGNLILQGDAADAYFTALDAMSPQPAEEAVWSRNTIDEGMASGLLAMIASDKENETARREAVAHFVSTLSREPSEFTFDFAVFGLDPACEGLAFGSISFVRGTYTSHVKLRMPLRNGEPFELALARVTVKGVDAESARKRAEQIVDRHLGVLNALLADNLPSYVRFSRSFVGTDTVKISSVPGHDRLGAQSEREVRLYSAAEFRENVEKYGVPRVSELFRTPGTLASRILAAYEIAGAACTERKDHEAFLLFAIALESVVLGKKAQSEITYQLATRIAYLIASKVEDRKKIVSRVKKLYDLRSKIVHAGSLSVAKTDVREIRYLCLLTLYELGRLGVTTSDGLDAWFEDRMLGGNSSSDEETRGPETSD